MGVGTKNRFPMSSTTPDRVSGADATEIDQAPSPLDMGEEEVVVSVSCSPGDGADGVQDEAGQSDETEPSAQSNDVAQLEGVTQAELVSELGQCEGADLPKEEEAHSDATDDAPESSSVCAEDSPPGPTDDPSEGTLVAEADDGADGDEASPAVEETASVTPPRRRMGALDAKSDCVAIIERLRHRLGAEGPPPLAAFSAVLENVADVTATVVVAEVVAAGVPPKDDTPLVDDGRWLAAHVAAQLDAMDRFVNKRLKVPFEGRNALPSEEKTRSLLVVPRISQQAVPEGEGDPAAEGDPAVEDPGTESPTDDIVEAAAPPASAVPSEPVPISDEEWGRRVFDLALPWGQRLLALVRTIRRDGNRIRADLATELRRRGGEAAYLERLDAALRRSVTQELNARDTALAELVTAVADAAMREAERIDARVVARWYRRGFARTLRADIDGLIRAIAAEERSLLMHLAHAAIDAAAGEAA